MSEEGDSSAAKVVSRSEKSGREIHSNSGNGSLRATLGVGTQLWTPDLASRLEEAGFGRVLSVREQEEYERAAHARVLNSSERSGDCILWVGTVNHSGYGYVRVASIRCRAIPVHRLCWIAKNGFLPIADVCVCHRCDVRRCVNADHLFLGTRGDNSRDMKAKGRQVVGERQHLSKLNETIVRDIRASNDTDGELAARYGVSNQTVNSIRHRKTWTHVA